MPTANVSITWTPPGTPITEDVAVTYTERIETKGGYAVPTITEIVWPVAMPKEMQAELTKSVYHGLNTVRSGR